MVALDIEKAFDTVWHEKLVQKLGAQDTPNYITKTICSYLTDRSFFVELDKTKSTRRHVSAGVPQGSILGPALFTFYIHDLPSLPTGVQLATYADDTAVYISYYKKQDFEAIKN